MKTTATTEIEEYCILRFYCPSNPDAEVYYCVDNSTSWSRRRKWAAGEEREHAYKFKTRLDARQAAKQGRCWRYVKQDGYKWEVLEVREIRVVTHSYVEDVVNTNANPLVALARCAEDIEFEDDD